MSSISLSGSGQKNFESDLSEDNQKEPKFTLFL